MWSCLFESCWANAPHPSSRRLVDKSLFRAPIFAKFHFPIRIVLSSSGHSLLRKIVHSSIRLASLVLRRYFSDHSSLIPSRLHTARQFLFLCFFFFSPFHVLIPSPLTYPTSHRSAPSYPSIALASHFGSPLYILRHVLILFFDIKYLCFRNASSFSTLRHPLMAAWPWSTCCATDPGTRTARTSYRIQDVTRRNTFLAHDIIYGYRISDIGFYEWTLIAAYLLFSQFCAAGRASLYSRW